MTLNIEDDALDLERYRVTSPREIANLLRQIRRRNQFVRIAGTNEEDSAVTAILDVDMDNNVVVIDSVTPVSLNQRLQEQENIRFETLLDNIRILFSVPGVESCEYEHRPALRFPLPSNVIRLQRREHYRVFVPVVKPVRCTLRIPDEDGETWTTAVGSLYNLSAGGLSITDDKKLMPTDIGCTYNPCLIDIPGSPLTLALQLMNVHDLTLANGKQIRRLGFMFVDPPNTALTIIQRYITKLERDQNARANGMA